MSRLPTCEQGSRPSRTRRGVLAAAAALVGGLSLAACSNAVNEPSGPQSQAGDDSATHPAAVVYLRFASFGPGLVTIHPGQTVKWVWADAPTPHNVSFTGFVPGKGAGSQSPGPFYSTTKVTGTFYHTFTVPGTYYYFCSLHQNMQAEVVVT
jgi:plastocyanin